LCLLINKNILKNIALPVAQARMTSAYRRPRKMCYKSLFKCAFVHPVNSGKIALLSSRSADFTKSTPLS